VTHPNSPARFTLPLRRRALTERPTGRVWEEQVQRVTVATDQLAVVICDMWDHHWSAGAALRVKQLVPELNDWCSRLRRLGVTVIHAPSDTMDAYEHSPARARAARYAGTEARPPLALPPPPFELVDGGSDTVDQYSPNTAVWTRQHPGIDIDEEVDLVSDEGREIAGYLEDTGRRTVLMTGVHTNLCVLSRSFGLAALIGYGLSPVLVSDLTDAMYDPARPPYVTHDEGTRLVVRYVEAFVAPTVRRADVLPDPQPGSQDGEQDP